MRGASPEQIRRWISRELEENPSWKVFYDKAWMCPFCVDIAVSDLSKYPNPVPRIFRHLTRECEAYASGKPEASVKTLRDKVFLLSLEAVVREGLKTPLWNFFNIEEKWFCPYCAQVTDIQKQASGVMVPQIIRHLRDCFAYDKGKGTPKHESYIRKLIEHEKRQKKLESALKKLLKENPTWTQKSSFGNWICPLCQVEQTHIDLSNPINITLNAPAQVAKHLLSACANFTPEVLARLQGGGTSQKPKTRVQKIAIREDSSPEMAPLERAFVEEPPASSPAEAAPKRKRTKTRSIKKPKSTSSQTTPLPGMTEPDEASLSATERLQISTSSLEMLPLLPAVEEVEFQYIYEIRTSSTVEIFDFVSLGDNKFGTLLLHMDQNLPTPVLFQLKEFIQTVAPEVESPKEFFFHLSSTFLEGLPMTFTLRAVYFIINLERNLLRMACAGYTPLLLINVHRHKNFHCLKPRGEALKRGSRKFQEEGGELKIKLQEEDLIVGYSPSFLEMLSEKGEPMSETQLYRLIFQYGKHEAEYLRHKFLEKLTQFEGKRHNKKNQLLVALKYKSREV